MSLKILEHKFFLVEKHITMCHMENDDSYTFESTACLYICSIYIDVQVNTVGKKFNMLK